MQTKNVKIVVKYLIQQIKEKFFAVINVKDKTIEKVQKVN